MKRVAGIVLVLLSNTLLLASCLLALYYFGHNAYHGFDLVHNVAGLLLGTAALYLVLYTTAPYIKGGCQ